LVRQAVEDTGLARRRNENIIYEYGHSSIAEGAVFGVAIQDIPRSLSIDLVTHRLASYTQLSYRYVPVERVPLQFFLPREFRDGRARGIFEAAIERAWTLYATLYERLMAHLVGTGAVKSEAMARRRATEDARYVLPLAQSTQLGMTANARVWGHVIARLLSHPLSEGQALGERLKETLQPLAPSLFPDKYIHALPFPGSALDALRSLAGSLPTTPTIGVEEGALPGRDGVMLVDYDPRGEERLAAALLFRVTDLDASARAALAARLSSEDRTALIRASFSGMTAHDAALRELEMLTYTVEIVHSEACYHQFIRHRMATQLDQPRRGTLGYTVPPAVKEAGCAGLYDEGMAVLEDTFDRLGGDKRASIVLGNGHNRRTLLHLNARELIELSRLRADKHAQWEVRDRTRAIVALVEAVHPAVAWACGGRDAFKAGQGRVISD